MQACKKAMNLTDHLRSFDLVKDAETIALKSYQRAFRLCLILTIISTITRDKIYLDNGLYIIAGLLVFGFLNWAYPSAKKVWTNPGGRSIRVMTHAALLYIAIVSARSIVSESLGLPGQDFEATVTLLALVSYALALLLLLASVCIGFGAFILMLALLVSAMSLPILNLLPNLLGCFFGRRVEMALKDNSNSFRVVSFFHLTAALIVSAMAYNAAYNIGSYLNTKNQLVKTIAYYTDYQYAKNYPGTCKAMKFKLHENGVISYAYKVNGHVVIFTDIVLPSKENLNSSTNGQGQRCSA